MLLKTRLILRIISALLCLSFFAEQTSYAAAGLRPAEIPFIQGALLNARIPESLALVKEFHRGLSGKTVIVLQDPHTNPSGQLNLAQALEKLLTKEKITTVFLEGGSGDDSLARLRDKAPAFARRSVAGSFVRKGLLSGAEYLNLGTDIPFRLWGVEDETFYWKAVEAYRAVAKDRTKFEDYLDRVGMTIDTLKLRLYNPSLFSFDQKRAAYLAAETSLADYLDGLASEAGLLGIDLGAYPALKEMDKIRHDEKNIDFQKANEEQLRAAAELSGKERAEFAQVLAEAPFKVSSRSHSAQDAFYATLGEKLDLSKYAELAKYLDYLKRAHAIDLSKVIAGQKALEGDIYSQLLRTQDEQRLHRSDENLRILKGLVRLTLLPEDYAQYKEAPQAFDIAVITGFLNKKIMDLQSQYERALLLESGYEGYVAKARDFYELTYERDKAFIANLSQKMDEEKETKAVLVAGGYHTPSLKALFNRAGFSYVVVTPQIFYETNLKRYENLLLGQNRIQRSDDRRQKTERSMLSALRPPSSETEQQPVNKLALQPIAEPSRAAHLAMVTQALDAVSGARMAGGDAESLAHPGSQQTSFSHRVSSFTDRVRNSAMNTADAVQELIRSGIVRSEIKAGRLMDSVPFGRHGARLAAKNEFDKQMARLIAAIQYDRFSEVLEVFQNESNPLELRVEAASYLVKTPITAIASRANKLLEETFSDKTHASLEARTIAAVSFQSRLNPPDRHPSWNFPEKIVQDKKNPIEARITATIYVLKHHNPPDRTKAWGLPEKILRDDKISLRARARAAAFIRETYNPPDRQTPMYARELLSRAYAGARLAAAPQVPAFDLWEERDYIADRMNLLDVLRFHLGADGKTPAGQDGFWYFLITKIKDSDVVRGVAVSVNDQGVTLNHGDEESISYDQLQFTQHGHYTTRLLGAQILGQKQTPAQVYELIRKELDINPGKRLTTRGARFGATQLRRPAEALVAGGVRQQSAAASSATRGARLASVDQIVSTVEAALRHYEINWAASGSLRKYLASLKTEALVRYESGLPYLVALISHPHFPKNSSLSNQSSWPTLAADVERILKEGNTFDVRFEPRRIGFRAYEHVDMARDGLLPHGGEMWTPQKSMKYRNVVLNEDSIGVVSVPVIGRKALKSPVILKLPRLSEKDTAPLVSEKTFDDFLAQAAGDKKANYDKGKDHRRTVEVEKGGLKLFSSEGGMELHEYKMFIERTPAGDIEISSRPYIYHSTGYSTGGDIVLTFNQAGFVAHWDLSTRYGSSDREPDKGSAASPFIKGGGLQDVKWQGSAAHFILNEAAFKALKNSGVLDRIGRDNPVVRFEQGARPAVDMPKQTVLSRLLSTMEYLHDPTHLVRFVITIWGETASFVFLVSILDTRFNPAIQIAALAVLPILLLIPAFCALSDPEWISSFKKGRLMKAAHHLMRGEASGARLTAWTQLVQEVNETYNTDEINWDIIESHLNELAQLAVQDQTLVNQIIDKLHDEHNKYQFVEKFSALDPQRIKFDASKNLLELFPIEKILKQPALSGFIKENLYLEIKKNTDNSLKVSLQAKARDSQRSLFLASFSVKATNKRPSSQEEFRAFESRAERKLIYGHWSVEINDFVIAHELRRKGIGTAFYKLLETYFQRLGFQSFSVKGSCLDDQETVNFWAKQGYRGRVALNRVSSPEDVQNYLSMKFLSHSTKSGVRLRVTGSRRPAEALVAGGVRQQSAAASSATRGARLASNSKQVIVGGLVAAAVGVMNAVMAEGFFNRTFFILSIVEASAVAGVFIGKWFVATFTDWELAAVTMEDMTKDLWSRLASRHVNLHIVRDGTEPIAVTIHVVSGHDPQSPWKHLWVKTTTETSAREILETLAKNTMLPPVVSGIIRDFAIEKEIAVLTKDARLSAWVRARSIYSSILGRIADMFSVRNNEREETSLAGEQRFDALLEAFGSLEDGELLRTAYKMSHQRTPAALIPGEQIISLSRQLKNVLPPDLAGHAEDPAFWLSDAGKDVFENFFLDPTVKTAIQMALRDRGVESKSASGARLAAPKRLQLALSMVPNIPAILEFDEGMKLLATLLQNGQLGTIYSAVDLQGLRHAETTAYWVPTTNLPSILIKKMGEEIFEQHLTRVSLAASKSEWQPLVNAGKDIFLISTKGEIARIFVNSDVEQYLAQREYQRGRTAESFLTARATTGARGARLVEKVKLSNGIIVNRSFVEEVVKKLGMLQASHPDMFIILFQIANSWKHKRAPKRIEAVLKRYHFLGPDGKISPGVRSIVLSAIPKSQPLRVVSPFTEFSAPASGSRLAGFDLIDWFLKMTSVEQALTVVAVAAAISIAYIVAKGDDHGKPSVSSDTRLAFWDHASLVAALFAAGVNDDQVFTLWRNLIGFDNKGYRPPVPVKTLISFAQEKFGRKNKDRERYILAAYHNTEAFRRELMVYVYEKIGRTVDPKVLGARLSGSHDKPILPLVITAIGLAMNAYGFYAKSAAAVSYFAWGSLAMNAGLLFFKIKWQRIEQVGNEHFVLRTISVVSGLAWIWPFIGWWLRPLSTAGDLLSLGITAIISGLFIFLIYEPKISSSGSHGTQPEEGNIGIHAGLSRVLDRPISIRFVGFDIRDSWMQSFMKTINSPGFVEVFQHIKDKKGDVRIHLVADDYAREHRHDSLPVQFSGRTVPLKEIIFFVNGDGGASNLALGGGKTISAAVFAWTFEDGTLALDAGLLKEETLSHLAGFIDPQTTGARLAGFDPATKLASLTRHLANRGWQDVSLTNPGRLLEYSPEVKAAVEALLKKFDQKVIARDAAIAEIQNVAGLDETLAARIVDGAKHSSEEGHSVPGLTPENIPTRIHILAGSVGERDERNNIFMIDSDENSIALLHGEYNPALRQFSLGNIDKGPYRLSDFRRAFIDALGNLYFIGKQNDYIFSIGNDQVMRFDSYFSVERLDELPELTRIWDESASGARLTLPVSREEFRQRAREKLRPRPTEYFWFDGPRNVTIAGVGLGVPERAVSNEDLATFADQTRDKTLKKARSDIAELVREKISKASPKPTFRLDGFSLIKTEQRIANFALKYFQKALTVFFFSLYSFSKPPASKDDVSAIQEKAQKQLWLFLDETAMQEVRDRIQSAYAYQFGRHYDYKRFATLGTGIETRRWLREGEAITPYLVSAVTEALSAALRSTDPISRLQTLTAENLGFKIVGVATHGMDQRGPGSGVVINTALNFIEESLTVHSLSAYCAGLCAALDVLVPKVANGFSHLAIIGVAEIYSRYLAPDSPSWGIFGDLAAAVALAPAKDGYGIQWMMYETESGAREFRIKGAETRLMVGKLMYTGFEQGFVMNGPRIGDMAADAVEKIILRAREFIQSGLHELPSSDPDQIQWYVFHQANKDLILKAVRGLKKHGIDIPEDRILWTLEDLGNTSAASTVSVLYRHRDKIKEGDLVLLGAFGDAFSRGGALIRWGGQLLPVESSVNGARLVKKQETLTGDQRDIVEEVTKRFLRDELSKTAAIREISARARIGEDKARSMVQEAANRWTILPKLTSRGARLTLVTPVTVERDDLLLTIRSKEGEAIYASDLPTLITELGKHGLRITPIDGSEFYLNNPSKVINFKTSSPEIIATAINRAVDARLARKPEPFSNQAFSEWLESLLDEKRNVIIMRTTDWAVTLTKQGIPEGLYFEDDEPKGSDVVYIAVNSEGKATFLGRAGGAPNEKVLRAAIETYNKTRTPWGGARLAGRPSFNPDLFSKKLAGVLQSWIEATDLGEPYFVSLRYDDAGGLLGVHDTSFAAEGQEEQIAVILDKQGMPVEAFSLEPDEVEDGQNVLFVTMASSGELTDFEHLGETPGYDDLKTGIDEYNRPFMDFMWGDGARLTKGKAIHPAEPFRIKLVQPIRLLGRAARLRKILKAGLNTFKLNSNDVYIDLLTDSGTGALSEDQLAASMLGDEAYAGSRSFRRMEKAIQKILGFRFILPTHQGRGAEKVLNSALLKPGNVVLGNRFFDTTTAHIEDRGAFATAFPIKESLDSGKAFDFKGNVDLAALERAVLKNKGNVGYILMTVTDNAGGGQPVSMANLKAAKKIAHQNGLLFVGDIARFAENAMFIKMREPGYSKKSIQAIVREMMRQLDMVQMSAKKDALVPIGGFLAMNSQKYYEIMSNFAIMHEGYVHYGGMSGATMDALAQGLKEVLHERYLRYRLGQVRYLGEKLKEAGIPIVEPVGGHAVFIDARKFLPHIPDDQFPAQALAVALYIESGVRAVEIGSLLAGRYPPGHKKAGQNKPVDLQLLRLTIPRRTYTQSHLDYVVEAVKRVYARRGSIHGLVFTKEPPVLRHFNASFRWAKTGSQGARLAKDGGRQLVVGNQERAKIEPSTTHYELLTASFLTVQRVNPEKGTQTFLQQVFQILRPENEALALDLLENQKPAIFRFTDQGNAVLATSTEGNIQILIKKDLHTTEMPVQAKGAATTVISVQDIRTLNDQFTHRIESGLQAELVPSTPIVMQIELDVLPERSAEGYLQYLIAELKFLKSRPYGARVYFQLSGDERLKRLALSDPSADQLFTQELSPALQNAAKVHLTTAAAGLKTEGNRNILVNRLEEGDIPAFRSILVLAVAAAGIDVTNIPQTFQDAWATLAANRPDAQTLRTILSGSARLGQVARYSLKPLTRVALNDAIRYFSNMIRMISQSA